MKDFVIDLANLNRELHYHLNQKHPNWITVHKIKRKIAKIENYIIKPTKTMKDEPFFDVELVFKIALVATVFTLLFLIASL